MTYVRNSTQFEAERINKNMAINFVGAIMMFGDFNDLSVHTLRAHKRRS